MQTAKAQRWPPDELLRTLLDAELAARDASNARARLRAAGFPVAKSNTWFMYFDVSRMTPGPMAWPHRPLPPPRGMTGTLCSAQMRTVATMSSIVLGRTTPWGKIW